MICGKIDDYSCFMILSMIYHSMINNLLCVFVWYRSSRGFMHMKIVNRDGKFILGQFSQPFDNIPQMIHHYSRNKLPIKGAEHMNLIRPIVNDML